jgi:O-acetyl-ADP-ribose deacetylase (regulator of RNase III)
MSKPKIEIHAGDITKLEVDAIVNAANDRLAPGGGVCGAIHHAAGPELAEACAKIGGCPTGGARITPGFRLPARHVIHAVGPVWQGGTEGEEDLLASCYLACLDLAKRRGLKSIAFPAISTGVYGFPLKAATAIAVSTVRVWLAREGGLERVLFAVFGADAEQAYRSALAASDPGVDTTEGTG